MTEGRAAATTFDGQRIRITTARSFDDVLTRLRQLVGTAAIEQYPAAMRQLDGVAAAAAGWARLRRLVVLAWRCHRW